MDNIATISQDFGNDSLTECIWQYKECVNK